MITNFKIFENINKGEPEIGDYVICEEKIGSISQFIKDFVNSNIGKIMAILDKPSVYDFWIHYDIPDDEKFKLFYSSNEEVPSSWRKMKRNEIKYWSRNKEDLEPILAGTKYNI